jgi:2-deoxy-D-gluconate 3-dehydrogenase
VERNFAVEQTLEQYDSVIETNLTASWLLCQSIGRYWLKEGMKGRIVNISSIFGTLGTALQAPYSISKGGVELMTRALSNDWSSRGINVNAIAPG